MNAVQKAIFPAILVSSLLMVFLSQLVVPHTTVKASESQTEAAEQPGALPAPEAAGEAEEQAKDTTPGPCPLADAYPGSIRQWCEPIQTAAAKHGLDPRLVAAVMLQESGGNPEAYSHSGAVGLMQVMPRDGLAADFMCSGRPCFTSRPSMEELFDPQFNIEYGTRMLAGLIERYGSVREALRAYGPMDVGYYYADLVLDIYESYR
ncbi:MAG TPA: lytic transglycosylase domain-containing protein [Chloroflexi bacterium]|jgi:soluble lytic murein transglycosylase-like protein|nr:lytic transglycosylase domain-containing protein [Chloroflexota bacterium]